MKKTTKPIYSTHLSGEYTLLKLWEDTTREWKEIISVIEE